ncbi:bifunctional folylpolyglutamate synthase/dihydrofolate synthase [Isoalcanivorax beigongshangi]|uniref:Dihydrofolate synthase/folylpolyglutamate synthase n=1 Tax=Isoalcanivorax beigongshangi TaxID=3238810 RepID=A0ABV4AG69_9GAMM
MARSLAQWLAHIESLHPAEIELGLERLATVADRLALRPWPGPVITVAGTNGKGSTVTLLDTLARADGVRTGLYTSPHLLRFNERVRIDGAEAEDAALVEAFEAVDAARCRSPEVALTYFEFTTLAGLWLFCRAGLDLLILEVGLGGRLDAVNLIDPTVAVITSVGLDHTDWLGDTRELIAMEKAGIRRAGRPLLYGEIDVPHSIAALDNGELPLLRQGREFGSRAGELYWQGGAWPLPATVALGEDNLATAVQALTLALRAPSAAALAQAAARTLPGRCEHHRRNGVDWYLDVGHNREAMARFARRVPASAGRTFAVCAMLGDKPAEAILALVPQVQRWLLAPLSAGQRPGNAERLAALLAPGSFDAYPCVQTALAAAAAAAQPGDRVLVCGSFYTVADAQNFLTGGDECEQNR